MLEVTKKLFPTDYNKFKEAMIEAAEDNGLPALLQMDDMKDITFKDVQDMFYEFQCDTGLEIEGHIFICDDCGRLHLVINVDYPDEQEERILQ